MRQGKGRQQILRLTLRDDQDCGAPVQRMQISLQLLDKTAYIARFFVEGYTDDDAGLVGDQSAAGLAHIAIDQPVEAIDLPSPARGLKDECLHGPQRVHDEPSWKRALHFSLWGRLAPA